MKLKMLPFAAVVMSAFATFTPASAQAQEVRPILVQNNCHRPVRLWINHADGWRNWHPHGEFTLPAYSSTYLEDNRVRLSQRTDHDLYIYAETLNGDVTWQGNQMTVVNGFNLPMRTINYSLQYAAYRVELTCR